MFNPCVAHRGASGLAPENTMSAFNAAMSFPFVQWIELDVQLSRNGVPVVIHDDTLNRTTSAAGRVADFTTSQLSRLDAGRWFSKSFAGESLPLLEQVLDATVGRCRLNIELKTYGGRYPGMERRVVELLYAKGLERDAVITSFDTEALRKVRELSPEVTTGLIIDAAPQSLVSDLFALGASFLSIAHKRITHALMAAMKSREITVMAWTVNDIATMKKLASIDPSLMICTNYPDRYGQLLLETSKR
ncbi:glycerophosphodiester phosphodiesterase [Paenibacillus sp. sptzw28]|uniref:glycerophosphodiester phosphodiesterase n=1 Tax=Paenibacillus sp. sptzw28 TaxID=715179 RepID=UPI001C6E6352|nr:glycerophosphodiester phosphodiesterase family protein [Paenibacillus sp. sptzw28]QYR20377.1 glycerophosphodiester phosphodiesterase [Paenibacillus sp. sptzw28]